MTASKTSAIRVNNVTLSYTDWPGERGPLICLPGLADHKGSFAPLARRLAPEYRLLALDLRGRGDSDKPDRGYGFAYHARDVLAFANALNIDTFDLIGHSFGATVGVYLASIRPTRVRAAVLLDGGADPEADVLAAMQAALRRLDRVYPSMDAFLERMKTRPFYRPWSRALEAYFRDDVHVLPGGNVRPKASTTALQRDMDVQFYYSMCLHFPALRCPTLFLHPRRGLLGPDQGHVLTDRVVAAITAWIPDCRLVNLPHVNHYTMLLHDNPPVTPHIRAFLADVLA
ncbi:MAG: alpha/beta fold hydrolase [Anaerolineae bacterium]